MIVVSVEDDELELAAERDGGRRVVVSREDALEVVDGEREEGGAEDEDKDRGRRNELELELGSEFGVDVA